MPLPRQVRAVIARRRGSSRRPVPESRLTAERRAAAAALRHVLATARPNVLFADVFDTLLVRDVHPEDVKRLAAQTLVDRFSLHTSAHEVYAVRARLEHELCLRNEAAGHDAEFRLRDLGEALHTELGQQEAGLTDVSRDAFAQAVLDVELEVERATQSLDVCVAAVLDDHVRAGGRLVLVSDFYIGADDLAGLLTAVGYTPDRYERLVVSSDTLRTKRSGRLYEAILAGLDVAASEVLMVGDNPWSDGASARRLGLDALVLDRSKQQRHYQALQRRLRDNREVARELRRACTTNAPAVFPEFSLTLAYAARELHRALHRDGVRDVLFLAREGEILMRLCVLLDELVGVPESRRLRTRYVCASRRSTFLASLGPLSSESFTSLFRQYRAISVREFLLNLGFSAAEAGQLAADAGLAPDTVVEDLPTSSLFGSLLADPGFQQSFETRRQEQRRLLTAYLDVSEDVRTGKAPLAVVDVGWKGTIQDHLDSALGPAGGTRGYYIGLVAPGAESERNQKTGVLYDFRRAEDRFYDVFDENRALYEVLLSAAHGSTARYEQTDDGVRPLLEQLTGAESRTARIVVPVQERVEERATAALRVLAGHHIDEDWLLRHVARRHARMVLLPTRRELEWFSRLTHEENFGLFRQTAFDAGPGPTPSQRLRNALSLARHPRAVLAPMFWPRLGISQLGLAPVGLVYSAWKARRLAVRS